MSAVDYLSIGKRIQRLRVQKGYSRESFADLVSLSPLEMAAIEAGRRTDMPFDILYFIAEALEVTFEYLVHGKEWST